MNHVIASAKADASYPQLLWISLWTLPPIARPEAVIEANKKTDVHLATVSSTY